MKVIEPESFTKKFEKKIPEQIREQFRKKILLLEQNPYMGKPLNYSFIRELKNKKFRLYYLINDKKVILVDCGNKKSQEKDIKKLKGFKYVKESTTNYMKETAIEKQNKLIEENNELLRSCIEALDDVKAGRYKVL